MAQLIKYGGLAEDSYAFVDEDAVIPSSGGIIVPLEYWQSMPQELAERTGPVGIWVHGDFEPAEIAAQLPTVALIAIHFPTFTDGRGYSLARILRDEFHYQGELRAIGDVHPDQMYYLWRCGFDSFLLPEQISIELALEALTTFRHNYQASTAGEAPLLGRS